MVIRKVIGGLRENDGRKDLNLEKVNKNLHHSFIRGGKR